MVNLDRGVLCVVIVDDEHTRVLNYVLLVFEEGFEKLSPSAVYSALVNHFSLVDGYLISYEPAD